MIDPGLVHALFAALRDAGDEPAGPLLWCYVFVGPSRARLLDLASSLRPRGYRLVAVEDDGGERHSLELASVERHSEVSLIARLAELQAFASSRGLALDGFDVMATDGEPLSSDTEPLIRALPPRGPVDQGMLLAFFLAAFAAVAIPMRDPRTPQPGNHGRAAQTVLARVSKFGVPCTTTSDCVAGSVCARVCTKDAEGNATIFVGTYCRP